MFPLVELVESKLGLKFDRVLTSEYNTECRKDGNFAFVKHFKTLTNGGHRRTADILFIDSDLK